MNAIKEYVAYHHATKLKTQSIKYKSIKMLRLEPTETILYESTCSFNLGKMLGGTKSRYE